MAFDILSGSSSMRTISAASIAASEPSAPIAIPMSALLSTGASFIPSPTNASFSFSPFSANICSTFSTLSDGKSSLYTSSIPSSAATCSATFLASPVSIMVFSTPALCSAFIASFEVGLITSDITICPSYLPSIATWTIVPTLWQSVYSTPSFFMSLPFPTATVLPSICAVTPCPLISSISETLDLSSTPPKALQRLLLIGCEEKLSANAAYSRSFSSSIVLWCTPVTSNTPRVIVPVLSNTTYLVLDKVSR